MRTDDGEIIHVEAASLKDFADGKRLFSRFAPAINKAGGAKYSELITMGVIEGGTNNGNPSCMFLAVHVGEQGTCDHFFVFEMSTDALRKLADSADKCEDYFEEHKTTEEQ